jgi:hypothetical protein
VKLNQLSTPEMLTESKFLRDETDQLTRVPIYKCHSYLTGGGRYLVMQILKQSVDDYIRE